MMMYEVAETQQREVTQISADINADILSELSTLNTRELALLRYVNRAMLSFIIKSDSLRN